jgi:hypothetical protein
MAHLMPHAMPNSTSDQIKWYIAIPCILPLAKSGDQEEPEAEYLDRMSRYVHGSRKKGSENRKPKSGIKHFMSNRIMLVSQDSVYDRNPCILVIPILTVDKTRDWNGDGYHAVVLASRKGTIQALVAYTQTLASLTYGDTETAEQVEIERAMTLLSCAVQTLCSMRRNHRKVASSTPPVVFSEMGVHVPVAKDDHGGFVVRKVVFDDVQRSNHDGHPAPDPALLVLKAAENWTRLCEYIHHNN